MAVANLVFSVCACIASASVAALAAARGIWVVAVVWALLAVGFAARAAERRRRGGRG